jgi:hypothetical protein
MVGYAKTYIINSFLRELIILLYVESFCLESES